MLSRSAIRKIFILAGLLLQIMINSQKPKYIACIWLTLIFLALAFSGFMLFEALGGIAGAIILIGLAASLTSFICIFIFKKRSDALDRALSKNDYIARWKFTKREWQDFLKREHSLRRLEKAGIFIVLSIITLIIFMVFILFIDEGRMAMLFVMLTLIMIYAAAAFIVPAAMFKIRNREDAEVLILKKGILLDRTFHTWDFPFSKLTSAKYRERPYKRLEVAYEFFDRLGPRDYLVLVPVPNSVDAKEAMKVADDLQKSIKRRKNKQK